MTLLTSDSIVPYTGNGSTSVFSYPRKFISNTHVNVTLDGVPTTAYSVSGAGSESGGSVTFDVAPLNGVRIVIYRVVPFTQETDLENFDGNPAVVHENQLDLIVMQTQNLDERVDRAITAPIDDVSANLVLPKAATRANGYPYFGSSGEILVTTDSVGTSTAAAAASAAAADSSADAAALSAAAASAAASSAMWSDVVFLTSASSPYTVTSGNSGDLLSVDTSGGAVVITLPQISTLTLPFNIGIKKVTSDANAVTINRSSTDTIGPAGTSKSLTTLNQGCTLVADTDPAPDQWAVGDFGDISTIPTGPTLGTPVATTSGTAIDFTGIPSTAKQIIISFNGVNNTASDTYIVQIGDSGGIETTSYSANYGSFLSGSAGLQVNASDAIVRIDRSGTAVSGNLLLTLLDPATNTWEASGNQSCGNSRLSCGSGGKSLSATLDRVRLTTVGGTGTFNAGSMNIQYQ